MSWVIEVSFAPRSSSYFDFENKASEHSLTPWLYDHENEDLTEKVKEANGEAEELFYTNNELNFNYEELKKKTYN